MYKPRNRFCNRSCAAKAKWQAGVLTADMVGRKRRHRPLPPRLVEVAASVSEELAALIQEQHDDDVPYVRTRSAGMVTLTAAVDEASPWEDPTAAEALGYG